MLFTLLFASLTMASSLEERLLPPQGASYERMWNWVLANSDNSAPKELPALGVAECDYNTNILMGGNTGVIISLESLGSFTSDSLSPSLSIPLCLQEAAPINPTQNVNESLRNQIESFNAPIVSAYGSLSHYVLNPVVASAPESSANDFLARQLIAQCVGQIKAQPWSSRIPSSTIERATSIKHLQNLSTSQVQTLLDPSANGAVAIKSGRVSSFQTGSIKDYSFSQIALNYSGDQKLALRDGLLAEMSCAEGQIWLGDGLLRTNECNQLISEMNEEISRGESSLKTALSGAACGIGRRLEGTGNMLYGALACGLTEIISSCEDRNIVQTLTNALALSASTMIAGMVPNGSALGDYSYLPGGHRFDLNGKTRPNVQGAAMGALVAGALRGVAFGEYDDNFGRNQIIGNSAGAVATYIGLGSFTDDRFTYAGMPTNTVNELVSGAIPGVIRSRYRQNQCADRLKAQLASLANNSQREASPAAVMQP